MHLIIAEQASIGMNSRIIGQQRRGPNGCKRGIPRHAGWNAHSPGLLLTIFARGWHPAEAFEWEDLFAAVDAARETFTIVELGAGYGRWSVAGVIMAQARGLRARAISIEAEPTISK
jgi:hypothetical protein